MSAKRLTLDTNILIYAVDRDAKKKYKKAMAILDQATHLDCVLTLPIKPQSQKKADCSYSFFQILPGLLRLNKFTSFLNFAIPSPDRFSRR